MTAFASTKMIGPINLGQKLAFAVYDIQLASSVGTGGSTVDFSSEFSTVYDVKATVGTSKEIFSWLHGVTGTADATNGGVSTASATAFVTYLDKASSAGAFVEAAGSDASTGKLQVLVFGIAK
jgi:hypothetical protein